MLSKVLYRSWGIAVRSLGSRSASLGPRLPAIASCSSFGTGKAVAAPQHLVVDSPYRDVYAPPGEPTPFTSGPDDICQTREPVSDAAAALAALRRSRQTQRAWAADYSAEDRRAIITRFRELLRRDADRLAARISRQMGKPLSQALGEVAGTGARVKAMVEMSVEALADDEFPEADGLYRRIVKEPVGVVLTLAPFNYPLLTAVNSIIPALLAGNGVLIKHSPRTPLCGEDLADLLTEAGCPEGLVSAIHCEPDVIQGLFSRPELGFVSFTGSVASGRSVYASLAQRSFLDCTLELGGKDAAYVARDADMSTAVATIVDGALYNAGQSCCGMERAYVHESKLDEFLSRASTLLSEYVLGDPFDEKTTLGPMALSTAPAFLKAQVDDAVSKSAQLICGGSPTCDHNGFGRFFQPTLLAYCNHNMDVMKEESFGPLLAVQTVGSDEEAVALMNDSNYGLTAALFTQDRELAVRLAPQLEVGTVFLNRCDFLDPQLPWSGVKDTGKGISLSKHGFRGVTKLKGYNFRVGQP